MARFRNHTGYPLTVSDLRRTVPPGGEFDWPAYDRAKHGTVTGCTRLDEPGPAAPPATPPLMPPAAPPPATPPPGDGGKPRTTTAADAAGKEND